MIKTYYTRSAIVIALTLFSLAAWANTFSQAQLQQFAQQTQFQFAVVNNYHSETGKDFVASITLNNQSPLALPKGESAWEIYFHFVRKIAAQTSQGLRFEHIQGDLHVMRPSASFAGLAAGQQLEIPFVAGAHIASYGEMMPRAFIVQQGMTPAIFANTNSEEPRDFVQPLAREEQYQRFKGDLYPVVTAASRYQDNLPLVAAMSGEKNTLRILPMPASMQVKSGNTELNSHWRLQYPGGLSAEADYLTAQLAEAGINLNAGEQGDYVLRLQLDEQLGGTEHYRLTIDKNTVDIIGSDSAGVFYGIQSLLALIPAHSKTVAQLPRVDIHDSPRFSWRGMHYDMARNFHGKDAVMQLITQMGRYKLNRLHLHLTEDEGWRLQIPGLPELTDIGAFRCFDLSESECLLTQLGTGPFRDTVGNGYYTREDFIAIIRHARANHIEVVPEIDMPGHSRAAIKAMEARYKRLMAAGEKTLATQYLLSDPQDTSQYLSVQSYSDNALNVCLPSTYQFIEKVVYELQQMYREAGTALKTYHMGGDEVGRGAWTGSPACKALIDDPESGVAGVADLKPYFVRKVSHITHARGLNLVGWEDGLMYDANNTFNRTSLANQQVIANAWDNIWEAGVADRAYRLANDGYQVILSPATHLYFDHPYEAHPEELGYYWATRYSDAQKIFAFMPDNLYANADRTHAGAVIDNLESLLKRPLVKLQKRENIIGLQGQLWSETVRTQQALEMMIFPRLAVMAERAWHKASWEGESANAQARLQDYAGFIRYLVTMELPKLQAAGVNFYLPPPGAIAQNGKLFANLALPGAVIEVSQDKGITWQRYEQGQTIHKAVWLRSRIENQFSRITEVNL